MPDPDPPVPDTSGPGASGPGTHDAAEPGAGASGTDPAEEDSPVRDDRLRLIFTRCHPAPAPDVQVALTPRLPGGLGTAGSRGRPWCPSRPWRAALAGSGPTSPPTGPADRAAGRPGPVAPARMGDDRGMGPDASAYLLPMTTTADEAGRDVCAALLPVGSHEQHGPYLPLATDTVIACTLAREIATAHPVRVLPPVTISCSHEHAAWPGTVSISARTLAAVVEDVAASLRRAEIPKLVLVNGHGGNYVLGNIVQEAGGDMALFPGVQDWADALTAAGIRTSPDTDMHAGEIETSILLHAHPELVRPGYENGDVVADDRRHLLTLGMAEYTASGVIGRPSLASSRKGRDLVAALVEAFGDHLRALDRR